MADSTAQVRGAQRFSAAVSRGLRESAVIALGVLGLVLLVALASYSTNDPGWSKVSESTAIHNRIGPVGAWVSDLLFYIFGRPSFLFPVMIGLVTWDLFRAGRRSESPSRANSLVRIAGFVLLMVASCGLATLHWSEGGMPHTAGGAIGDTVGRGLKSSLEFLGATLLLLAAWMAGASLSLGVSWLTVMDRLGGLELGRAGLAAQPPDRAPRGSRRARPARSAQGQCRDRTEEGRDPQAHPHRGAAGRGGQERAGGEGAAGAAVRGRQTRRTAAAQSAG